MTLLNKQTVLEHLYKRLIETANNNVGFECDAGIVFEKIATDRIKTWLDEVQTVDAVPVIRCKDCIKKRICTNYRYAKVEEGFCAWADRKEE